MHRWNAEKVDKGDAQLTSHFTPPLPPAPPTTPACPHDTPLEACLLLVLVVVALHAGRERGLLQQLVGALLDALLPRRVLGRHPLQHHLLAEILGHRRGLEGREPLRLRLRRVVALVPLVLVALVERKRLGPRFCC